MVVEYEIVERHDSRGIPAFFIMADGVELTSRWTRDDADRVVAQLQSQPTVAQKRSQLAQLSAQEYRISHAQMAELRHAIMHGPLPAAVRHVGQAGASFDAYVVDFDDTRLVALHDRREQLITVFMPEDHVDLDRPEHWPVRPGALATADPVAGDGP